jgi:hypothetical protein
MEAAAVNPQDLAVILSHLACDVPQICGNRYMQLSALDENSVTTLLPHNIGSRSDHEQHAMVRMLVTQSPGMLRRLCELMQAARNMQPDNLTAAGVDDKFMAAVVWDAATPAGVAATPAAPATTPAAPATTPAAPAATPAAPATCVNSPATAFADGVLAASAAADPTKLLAQLVKDGKLVTVACVKLIGPEAAGNMHDLEAAFAADSAGADAARAMHGESADMYINKHDPDKQWAGKVREALAMRLHTLSIHAKLAYMEDLGKMGLLGAADVPGAHTVGVLKLVDDGEHRQKLLDVCRQGMDYDAFLQVAKWHGA